MCALWHSIQTELHQTNSAVPGDWCVAPGGGWHYVLHSDPESWKTYRGRILRLTNNKMINKASFILPYIRMEGSWNGATGWLMVAMQDGGMLAASMEPCVFCFSQTLNTNTIIMSVCPTSGGHVFCSSCDHNGLKFSIKKSTKLQSASTIPISHTKKFSPPAPK